MANLNQEDLLNYLERKRAIKTLLCLINKNDDGLDNLLEKIGGSKTTGMARILDLVEMGLVEKTTALKEPRKMFYKLTDEGIKIAEKVKGILDSLE